MINVVKLPTYEQVESVKNAVENVEINVTKAGGSIEGTDNKRYQLNIIGEAYGLGEENVLQFAFDYVASVDKSYRESGVKVLNDNSVLINFYSETLGTKIASVDIDAKKILWAVDIQNFQLRLNSNEINLPICEDSKYMYLLGMGTESKNTSTILAIDKSSKTIVYRSALSGANIASSIYAGIDITIFNGFIFAYSHVSNGAYAYSALFYIVFTKNDAGVPIGNTIKTLHVPNLSNTGATFRYVVPYTNDTFFLFWSRNTGGAGIAKCVCTVGSDAINIVGTGNYQISNNQFNGMQVVEIVKEEGTLRDVIHFSCFDNRIYGLYCDTLTVAFSNITLPSNACISDGRYIYIYVGNPLIYGTVISNGMSYQQTFVFDMIKRTQRTIYIEGNLTLSQNSNAGSFLNATPRCTLVKNSNTLIYKGKIFLNTNKILSPTLPYAELKLRPVFEGYREVT